MTIITKKDFNLNYSDSMLTRIDRTEHSEQALPDTIDQAATEKIKLPSKSNAYTFLNWKIIFLHFRVMNN